MKHQDLTANLVKKSLREEQYGTREGIVKMKNLQFANLEAVLF